MKFLKYLFFLLLISIIGLCLYIATLEGSFQVEESKLIQAPSEMLFDEVNNLETWEKWSPWTKMDSTMIITYAEKTLGEGAGYSWKSDKMNGSIATTKVIPGNSINQEIIFNTPLGESQSHVYWKFEKMENGTKVTWGMKGEQRFWEKAYQLTQDSTASQRIRPMLQAGLTNLEAFVKKAMEEFQINVDGETTHGGGFYMYMTTASRNTPNALDVKIKKILPYVSLYMKQNNIQITGAPMTVYNHFDPQSGTVIISSGLPTSSRIITPEASEVLCGLLPTQRVIKTTLKGNYDHLSQAWAKAKKYILANEYEINEEANPFEVYITGPLEIANPAEWVTEIYIPVK